MKTLGYIMFKHGEATFYEYHENVRETSSALYYLVRVQLALYMVRCGCGAGLGWAGLGWAGLA